jgi:predicted porin
MKNLAIIAILATVAGMASADEISAFVKNDYDTAAHTSTSVDRAVVGAKYNFGGNLGAVDGGVALANVHVNSVSDNAVGYDIGYSNGVTVGPVALTGRIGYTHSNFNNVGYVRDISSNVAHYAVEAALPVTSVFTGFIGAERLHGQVYVDNLSGNGNANRYTAGTDIAVSKNVDVRVGYARTEFSGGNANGITTNVSYKF